MRRNHRLAVAASIGVLIATGGAAQASALTSTSAGVVCPASCDPQPYPAECDDLTAQDQADWDNYWYNGVPLPHPELAGLYAECFGF